MLEPISDHALGQYRDLLGNVKVFGLIRRSDLSDEILQSMRARRDESEWLRVRKSRRWNLPGGFPQLGWEWEAVFDFGPYKSQYNGKHDLPGGRQCAICHTWHRYGHLIVHPVWKERTPIVGPECAVLLSDLDPKWAEKKLAEEVKRLAAKRLQEDMQRQAEERMRRQAEVARLEREARAAQEASETADAMLRDYAARDQYAEERLESALRAQLAVRSQTNAAWGLWKASMQRRIGNELRAAMDGSRRNSLRGNVAFRTQIAGLPFSGTVYQRGEKWRCVWNIPDQSKHSRDTFVGWHEAWQSMEKHLRNALYQYVETDHARQNYAPPVCRL